MKNKRFVFYLSLILNLWLVSCGPAILPAQNYAGTWTTNLGTINFVQDGYNLKGSMEGYGGFWSEVFNGAINEQGIADFETEVLGNFSLKLDGDTFKSTSSDLSFCGIRGENMELPTGCGFSGKWIATSKFLKNEGYLVLTQIGPSVTGDLYNALGDKYSTFEGTVEWGKGWRANGIATQRGNLSLQVNAAETGFELNYDESGNPNQLCAIREGLESAYLSYFTCKP